MLTVIPVPEKSPHLSSVKSLWGANRQTLGFFPDGAFSERARKGQILAAIDGKQTLGYVLFYTNKRSRVRLTHLCVSSTNRGKGVARALISALRSMTKSFRGIGLYCRRDFPAWQLWPKLGFQAVREKIGHSQQGYELTYFWLPNPHGTLFPPEGVADESRVTIAIDANIFFDLLDENRMEAGESLALIADWLQPVSRLCVTPELFNEIQNNPEADERKLRMDCARNHECVEASVDDFNATLQLVEATCGSPSSPRDAADLRQLAWAIAGDADVFVTRDLRLLSHAEDLYRMHGLSVERPSDVISRFEEIRNEHDYQRSSLAGTDIQLKRQSKDAATVAEAFLLTDGSEKKVDLVRMLNLAFAHPDRFVCKTVCDAADTPLCLLVVEHLSSLTSVIRLLRLSGKQRNTRLGGTLVRTLLTTVIYDAAMSGRILLRIEESNLDAVVTQALEERGFILSAEGWLKLNFRGIVSVEMVASRIREIARPAGISEDQLDGVLRFADQTLLRQDSNAVLHLEHLLWPGKVDGANVPCFVIPIIPEWATDLFDGGLAKNRLWKADVDLVLNPDSVYYRAVKPRVLTATGRILWYVSEGRVPGSKMVRASSQLTGVEIGTPKDLFRRFRRFGVYEWRNVLDTAGAEDGELMAVEFTDTELFPKPIRWTQLQDVFHSHGRDNHTFPSPLAIDEKLFFELYSLGSASTAL